jgi:hypothetical protein
MIITLTKIDIEVDPSSKIITPESLLAIYKVREIIQEIEALN